MRSGGREFTGRMASVLRALAVGAVLLAMAACERPSDPTRHTLPRERFIEVYIDLRQIDPAAPDAAERRRAVLEEHGVTEDEMRAFVQAREQRPQELAAIWAEIQERIEQREAEAAVGEEEIEAAPEVEQDPRVEIESPL